MDRAGLSVMNDGKGMGCGGMDVVIDVGSIRVVSLDGVGVDGTDGLDVTRRTPFFFLPCRGVAGAEELPEAFLIRHRPFCSHLPSFCSA